MGMEEVVKSERTVRNRLSKLTARAHSFGGKSTSFAEPSKVCVICRENECRILIFPCKHLCLCEICSQTSSVKSCPLCRTLVDQKMKIFL
mmetsp:Transcript_10428/g.14758  ORF Transcript_10428/g.14758 Transcript_10428/m.14758 type:complete len:90 (+) Transcript_10428:39-308(+)